MKLSVVFITLALLPNMVLAQEETVEVGKFVNPSTSASSMILALLLVLCVIVVCAMVLKRFNLTTAQAGDLKVITSLSLGTKERLMVVQVGEKQLLLGVTAQQISVLDTLDTPLKSTDTAQNISPSLNAMLSKFAHKKQ